MKKTGLFAASASAAAAAALSVPPSSAGFPKASFSQQQEKTRDEEITCSSRRSEKFAPRFDGLRFIETLVTAHR